MCETSTFATTPRSERGKKTWEKPEFPTSTIIIRPTCCYRTPHSINLLLFHGLDTHCHWKSILFNWQKVTKKHQKWARSKWDLKCAKNWPKMGLKMDQELTKNGLEMGPKIIIRTTCCSHTRLTYFYFMYSTPIDWKSILFNCQRVINLGIATKWFLHLFSGAFGGKLGVIFYVW